MRKMRQVIVIFLDLFSSNTNTNSLRQQVFFFLGGVRMMRILGATYGDSWPAGLVGQSQGQGAVLLMPCGARGSSGSLACSGASQSPAGAQGLCGARV